MFQTGSVKKVAVGKFSFLGFIPGDGVVFVSRKRNKNCPPPPAADPLCPLDISPVIGGIHPKLYSSEATEELPLLSFGHFPRYRGNQPQTVRKKITPDCFFPAIRGYFCSFLISNIFCYPLFLLSAVCTFFNRYIHSLIL